MTYPSKWREAFVVLDWETTGLSPNDGHRPVEMGIARYENEKLVERANFLINPGFKLEPKVSKIHGLTDADLKDAPTFEEVFFEVRDMFADAVPVAYNAPFDRRYLQNEVRQLGHRIALEPLEPALDGVTWLDPRIWATTMLPGAPNHKLTTVTKELRVELENAHQADADAIATAEVLLRLAPKLPGRTDELLERQKALSARQAKGRFERFSRYRAGRRHLRKGDNVEIYICDGCGEAEPGSLNEKKKWGLPDKWARFRPKTDNCVTCTPACDLFVAWRLGEALRAS